MNARQNFYSSVFEVINSYKQKDQDSPHSGLLGDHLLDLGVFAAVLLVASFSGTMFVYPKYMTFGRPAVPLAPVQVAAQPASPVNLFESDSAAASEQEQPELNLLMADKDTYINATTPEVSYATAKVLRVNSKPEQSAYVQFSIEDKTVLERATLIIPNNGTSEGTVDVYALSNTAWDPSKVSYSNQPVGDERYLGTVTVAANSLSRLNVTSQFENEQSVTVVFRSASTGIQFSSLEDPTQPTVLLEIQ